MRQSIIISILFALTFLSPFQEMSGQTTNDNVFFVADDGVFYCENFIRNTSAATMNINGKVTLKGDFINQGTVHSDSDGTLQYEGEMSSMMMPGAGNYSIISMDKEGVILGAADVVISGNLKIDSLLDFSDGMKTRLVIGDHNITMAKNAIIQSADETRYIVTNGDGKLEKLLPTPGIYTFPVGDMLYYSPITSDISGITLGTTEPKLAVNVQPVQHPNLLSEATSFIKRYWNVTASDVTNYWNDMTGTYVDPDIVGNDASIIGSYNTISGDWIFANASGMIDNNTVSVSTNDIDTDFTGQNFSGTLPVTLLSFDVEAKGADALLTWETSTEMNNEKFIVEYSLDGLQSFTKAGEVRGAGTTNKNHSYSYVHKDIGLVQTKGVYYRLLQVDFDGTEQVHPVRYVSFDSNNQSAFALHPNVVYRGQDISVKALNGEVFSYVVYNVLGVPVIIENKATHNDVINTSELISGKYFLSITGHTSVFPFIVR